jgi:hypothetical protein
MSLSGLGGSLSMLMRARPGRKCERCGMRYKASQPQCPYCHELSDAALAKALKERQKSSRTLGMWLVVAAACLALLTLCSAG